MLCFYLVPFGRSAFGSTFSFLHNMPYKATGKKLGKEIKVFINFLIVS